MQVRVLDESGEVIWSQGKKSGMTFLSHREDGTIDKIIAALESALAEARNESLCPISELSAPC
ncbi:Rrf2 family transcriptional regulator [Pseudomonas proteolytica]|uniref:Rrf2 family transcriptional regulator n=1 Tax=Pseudomonas proteolytica TaxID=219574 RepID=A0AAW5AGF0_9PSED|nr:hypothetical protein [Pseudomonas proteolytica]MCF5059905.1 Rrf2 family transcriptional regulator [Pseudomonas proteolytica]MCF5102420.1 Rrf2 family transcriptional regulator [Pseudomonas proteolytica]